MSNTDSQKIGAPVLLCATRSEAAPLLARMKLTTRIPGIERYLVWGRLDGTTPVIAGVSGMGGERAKSLTRCVLDTVTPSHLIWYGVAGGLLPGLTAGDLLLPSAIRIHPDRREYIPTPDLRGIIGSVAGNLKFAVTGGGLLEVADVISGTTGKAALGRDTGCLACDMESGSFASIASSSGFPWCVVRSIFDPVEDNLPEIPPDILDENGSVRPFKALRAFLAEPRGMLSLGKRNRVAMKNLVPLVAKVAHEIGPPPEN